MWEIFSFGEKPYNGMKHNDLKNFLKREERIPVSQMLNIDWFKKGSWVIWKVCLNFGLNFKPKVPAPYLKEPPNAKEIVKKVYDEIMWK